MHLALATQFQQHISVTPYKSNFLATNPAKVALLLPHISHILENVAHSLQHATQHP